MVAPPSLYPTPTADSALSMLENDSRCVEFICPDEAEMDLELTPDVRRHTFLFFKEAVTNIARHACATGVHIHISRSPPAGCIFLCETMARDSTPLRSATAMVSVECAIEPPNSMRFRLSSAPAQGTEIELVVPPR